MLPTLGALPATKLTRGHVANLVRDLCERYAPNTVRISVETLGSVLAAAVGDGVLQVNVARGIHQLRREVAVEWLDSEEAVRLLDVAEERSGRSQRDWARYVKVSLALLCGLRRGEILGLRWRDVDLAARRLTVARSYAGPPKNGQARHLPLPDELLPILRAWRPRCPLTPENLVCPVLKDNKKRWGMGRERSDFGLKRLLAASGCRPLRRGWHALRHTFASLFVQAGGDLFALSKLLGHADARETQVYAHLSPDFLASARARLRIRG